VATTPPRPPIRPNAPALFALGLLVLAVVVTATWMITWSVAGDDGDSKSTPAANPEASSDAKFVDMVRTTMDSIYNFTPDTIDATMKSAGVLLCDSALEQWNTTADPLRQIVETNGRSVVTSNAHYGIVDQDTESVTVLAVFEVSESQAGQPPEPAEPAAVEFTVDRTATPLCINTIETLS
jgi:hypothetical protein